MSLKITNSLAILRLRKPLKTSTRLAGHGICTRDLPNASLVRYQGATSLGWWTFVFTDERKFILFKSDGQEKVWRRKNCELDDKILTATMLNTMDNGAAGARKGLGDLK